MKGKLKELMWRSHGAVDDAFDELKGRGMLRLD